MINPLFDKSLVKNCVIVFIGAPLVGKGTQSKLLADFLDVPVVSSGDVFREVAKSGSQLGNELHSIMSQGGLVPNELVLEVFLEYLAQLQFAEGFILDGFVRELENLDTLHYICEELGLKLLTFIYLQEPSEEDLIQRVEQRLQECKRQGIAPRADDRVDVFQRRWKVYQEKTLPVIEYLRDHSDRYHLLTIALKKTEEDRSAQLLPKDVLFSIIQEQLIHLIFSSSSSFSFNRSYRASTPDQTTPSLFDLTRLLSHKFEQLESQLKSKYQSIDKEIMTPLLCSYLQLSLKYNANKRTGVTRRCIFLVSSNRHKLQEFVRIFDYYGIEVLLLPHELRYRYYGTFYELLKQPPFLGSGVSIIGIIKEYTSLIRYYSMRIKDEKKTSNNEFITKNQFIQAEIRHNAKVVHLSQLDIFEYDISVAKVIKRQFIYKTPGYIDLTRSNHLYSNDIFGWDDIFVVEKNGWTYNQLKQFGFKISSRDMNISLWMKEKIYYKRLTDLNFTPLLPIPSPPSNDTSVANVLTSLTNEKTANDKVYRSIDFHIDVYEDFFLKHPYYTLNNDVIMKQSDLLYLFYHVMNQGIYFRASHNRRLKNYWCPGLNAGLPLTPKKDEIHEATFLVHDFGHFGLPDLIYIGETTSSLHKLVYITWRMLSEALTMTISDMIFVDTLVKGNIQYDYEKRAIYPLFAAVDLPIFYPTTATDTSSTSCHYKMNLANLKRIIRANYQYCLLGDDREYRQLLKEAAQRHGQQGEEIINDTSLLKFQAKYSAFFIEDFKWTNYNYENMCQKSDSIARWWKQIQPLLKPTQPSQDSSYPIFYTIDDIIERLQLKEIWFNTSSTSSVEGSGGEEVDDYERKARDVIDVMFEYIIEHMIFPLFSATSIESKEVRRDRAFRRYFLGQCAIFAKYDVIPESEETFQQLLQLMMTSSSSSSKALTIEVIDEIRGRYDGYLQLLVDKNLISEDDKLTYAESFPLFDPMYLTYDQDHSHLSLKDISADILFQKPRFFYPSNSSSEVASSALGLYPLLPNYAPSKQERFYLHVMQVLLEHTQAHVVDDVFVVKPGVMLLADVRGFEYPKNLLTFLIAGVSVEASLELIGHREASVARLTSSKTNAMNLPFYRIFSSLHRQSESSHDSQSHSRHSYQNTLLQKQLIRDIQLIRHQYQQQFHRLNVGKGGANDVSNSSMREKDTQEMLNVFNQSNKCTFLCYSMTIEDLHKLFIGRGGYDGNESEVREVIKMMHSIVKGRYPQSFLPWEDYLQANNLSKVTSSSSSLSISATSLSSMNAGEVLQTSLTREATQLFTALNINKEQSDYLQLADFRSRVTYLSFPKTYQKDLKSVLNYHRKVIVDLGHMSVLAAYQIAVTDEVTSELKLITTKAAMARVMQNKKNKIENNEILLNLFKDIL